MLLRAAANLDRTRADARISCPSIMKASLLEAEQFVAVDDCTFRVDFHH